MSFFCWLKKKFKKSGTPNVENTPAQKMAESEVVANVSMILHDEWVTLTGLIRINSSFDYWVDFITALAYVESGYNPKLVFMEPAPLYYESIGLLQLSTVDFKNYKYPAIDLKNGYENLKFGIFILNKLAMLHGKVIYDSGNYWSTLRPGKNKESHARFLAKLKQLQLTN